MITKPTQRTRAGVPATLAILVALPVALGGCGRLGQLFMPDPHPLIPAEFSLPKGNIAILIDDYMVTSRSVDTRQRIAEKIVELVKSQWGARKTDFISYQRVIPIKMDLPDGKKRSIQRIGEELGADAVLYINITQFDIQGDPESPLILPAAQANAKVVNVASGERLWPIDYAGHPVQVRGRREPDTFDRRDTQQWTNKLADMLGEGIAELFYTHRNEE